MTTAPAAYFSDEQLILVDEDNRQVGTDSKLGAHAGDGKLHRAFSVFVFDRSDRVFLHRRSKFKPLWPDFWTNSCCSHPRHGEQLIAAVERRVFEELGFHPGMPELLFEFVYHARFEDVGSEYEHCSVFEVTIESAEQLLPSREEMSDWGWFSVAEVDDWLLHKPDTLSPWFKLEWPRVRVGRCSPAL